MDMFGDPAARESVIVCSLGYVSYCVDNNDADLLKADGFRSCLHRVRLGPAWQCDYAYGLQ